MNHDFYDYWDYQDFLSHPNRPSQFNLPAFGQSTRTLSPALSLTHFFYEVDVDSTPVCIYVIVMSYKVCVRARELFGDFGCLIKSEAATGKWSMSSRLLFSI